MFDHPGEDSPREIHFGPHLFRWEPPDLGHLIYDGSVDGAMVTSFSQQARPLLIGRPHLFMLVDVTRLAKLSAEGRKASAEGSKDLDLRGTAVIGASPVVRVLAGLVGRAVALVNNSSDNPTRFFDTEREARAWIAARRSEVHRNARPKGGLK